MTMTVQLGENRVLRRAVPGARKLTPDALAAHKAARVFAQEPTTRVTRLQALKVAKRAAAALGLKATKIALIDHLFGFSPEADWANPKASPIVWPSNELLARRLGLSISAARYHLRGLVRFGLVAYSAHPTYQRRGVRDRNGRIVEAFGINLSPLITRYEELSMIADAYELEALERKRLRTRRTQIRREVEAVIETACRDRLAGSWDQLHARLDSIREQSAVQIDELMGQIAAFENLRDDAEDELEGAFEREKLDTAQSNLRQQQTTADLSVLEKSNPAASHQHEQLGSAYGNRFTGSGYRQMFQRGEAAISKGVPAEDSRHISLALVRDACPAIIRHAPDAFRSWRQLCAAGRALCAPYSINVQVWQEAQTHLGPDIALAALAVTVQRADSGQVINAGAYLRTLVQRGRAGRLFISRSLFALASARCNAGAGIAKSALPYRGFPSDGISWTPWAEVVRTYAPRPTPDVEMVANAFRAWCKKGHINIAQPSIETAFIGFCKKWRMH